jgi:rfaE bifunctional protein nucleotidyltransferase chain/domain
MDRSDELTRARAIYIDASSLITASRAASEEAARAARLFRIVPVPEGGVNLREVTASGIELPASWLIGCGPDIGYKGCIRPDRSGGIGPALRRILRAEDASRVVAEAGRLAEIVSTAKKRGKRIVFTNGVFDLLHAGHLRLLAQARKLGDLLIVAINSDLSARRIKGPGRPLVPQFTRAEHLVSLRAVDWCVIFTDPDPMRLLRLVRPDILVKGSDYTLSRVVGARLVAGYGGSVVRIPVLAGLSTSATINRARALPIPRRKA